MVFVINGFEEPLQLPYSSTVNHQHKRHPDWVLHFGQIVVYNISLVAGTGQDYRTQNTTEIIEKDNITAVSACFLY